MPETRTHIIASAKPINAKTGGTLSGPDKSLVEAAMRVIHAAMDRNGVREIAFLGGGKVKNLRIPKKKTGGP